MVVFPSLQLKELRETMATVSAADGTR